MKEAKKQLIIIDRYADKVTLDMISRLKINVILIVKKKGLLKELDIQKYNEQYHNLALLYSDSFHDRYLVIDQDKIYHCGASINHAGNRTFCINILEEKSLKEALLKDIRKIKDDCLI